MNPHRILMPTDVPFWRQSTGAQKRICSLVRYLNGNGFHVQTFCLRGPEEGDDWVVEKNELDVVWASSATPPRDVGQKLKWYADATLHQVKQWFSSSEDLKADSLTLDEFRWPWAIQKFSEQVRSFKPDSILVQYVKFAYLLEALTPGERKRVCCALDTHDLLHLRVERFHENGLPHWLNINRAQEAAVFREFDLLIAIQHQEAGLIREMAPECRTVVAGHSLAADIESLKDANPTVRDESALRVGYLGSKNLANWAGIREFLLSAWSELPASGLKLLVGGSICEMFVDEGFVPLDDNVQLLGYIEEIETFYEQVDLIVNPVRFGTGLKIKSCEAFAYSKPLITTEHGFGSLPSECGKASIVVDEIPDMEDAIMQLLNSPKRLLEMQQQAGEIARSFFSEQQAYSELAEALLSYPE